MTEGEVRHGRGQALERLAHGSGLRHETGASDGPRLDGDPNRWGWTGGTGAGVVCKACPMCEGPLSLLEGKHLRQVGESEADMYFPTNIDR